MIFSVFLTVGWGFAALNAQEPNRGNEPARFEQVGEIVDHWRADQHLWVKGDLGVSDSHLDELERWLEENAANWTIVLMQNAQGQRFQNYRGMNAVEHALGKQLANRTDFGNLRDERTGESNGAFFILFLEERKFSYYASDAFDRRSLGEKRWVGRLDKPAIAAMRGGGRVVDAAKDTVTSIESQLTRKITGEAAAKRRAAIARQQAIEEARQLAGEIEVEIDRMEAEVAQLRDEHPAATGDLVQPPTASWRGAARAIAEYAAAEDIARAGDLADQVKREIAGSRSGLARWTRDAAELERLQARLDEVVVPADLPTVAGHLSRAEAALASARDNHAQGESLYREQIEVSDQALDRAGAEIEAWRAAVLAEQRRLEARRKAIRVAAVVAGLLFLIALIVLNRLRAPAKRESETLLRDWERQLKGKFDQLFALMDRATVIVGPASQLPDRGFGGATLALCRETIREVDELFIMSSATDSVVDRVESLVHPRSPWGGLVNAFFSHRYRKAIALLNSQPIGFEQDQGLGAILEPTKKSNTEAAGRSLLGDPGDYAPFQMSFEALISAYDEKQAAAIATVDRLERCIDGLPLLLETLSGHIGEVERSATDLAQAATRDGFFSLENLRNVLLPAARTGFEKALTEGRADPVTARENAAADVDRQLAAASRLTARLERLRSEDFVTVEETAEALESRGRRVAWIDPHYADLSNQAEQLSVLMVDREVSEALDEFEEALLRVRGRVISADRLARRAEEEIAPAIESAATEAAWAREDLAKALGLPPGDVLAEEGLSPFTKIADAGRELEAARIALDRGRVELTQEDFAEIETLIDEAGALLELSREVCRIHGERLASLETVLGATRREAPATAGLLEEMRADYAPEVLRFSARTGREGRGQDSIRESLDRATERLAAAEEALRRSGAAFSRGHLIEAGGRLERADNEIGFARHQLALVEDQHAALKEAEEKNKSDLADCQRGFGRLASDIADRRTRQSTLDQYDEAGNRLRQIEADHERELPNPFAVGLALASLEEDLNAIEQGIASDRTLFDNATATAGEARKHLEKAEQLVHQAETDQIPDSARLEGAIQRHRQLAEVVTRVESILAADHADWPEVQEAALTAIEEIVETRELMESELRAARQAVDALRRASATLSELQGWRSRHRVKLDRQAGWGFFVQGREALAGGEYPEAIRRAGKAYETAQWELNSAHREERQAEAAAEAARRRRQAALLSSSSSSSFSSGGSSFSGGGGSSGFSSGSFSSGSGVSRSGW